MKGYKGFEKGLVCRGKQYAENTVFEEDNAEICKSGMHFCERPIDVFAFYPPCDANGNPNDFAEVEALDEALTDDNIKYTTKKLKVGAKIGLVGLINAEVEYIKEQIAKTPEKLKSVNSGYRSSAVNSGDSSSAVNSGYRSSAVNNGYSSSAVNSGDSSSAVNSGYRSSAVNNGDSSSAVNSGDSSSAVNSGDRSSAVNSGYRSSAVNSGYRSSAVNSGYSSSAVNSGDSSSAVNSGDEGVAIALGISGKAKSSLGGWIVIAEWKLFDGKWHRIDIQSARVDGERIKANVFYKLIDGEFIEQE